MSTPHGNDRDAHKSPPLPGREAEDESGDPAPHHSQLVTMANQIGSFFRYQDGPDEAARNIARHLSHFWALSMRRDLAAHLDRGQDESVDPLVVAAVARYRAELTSYGGRVPGEQALEHPKGGGDAG